MADDHPVPVVGDFNASGCVDNSDISVLVQSIGLTVPPADPQLDLNLDQIIDFNDYLLLNLVGDGCAQRS